MVEKQNYSKQINKICEIISNDIKKLSYVESLVKNFIKLLIPTYIKDYQFH